MSSEGETIYAEEVAERESDDYSPYNYIEEAEDPLTFDEQHLIEEILHQAVAVRKEKDFPSSASKNKSDASHNWIRQDLFSSSNSLKKAFVLKEILDKPKSLRSFSV